MKAIYGCLFVALSLLFAGCQPDDVKPERNGMQLIVPEGIIDMSAMTEEQENDVVATVRWTPATPIGEGYEFQYLFQMDVADNGFATASPALEVPAGQEHFDLTVGYFYENVVERWGKPAKEPVNLEVRVVAKVLGPTFEYPEIATGKVEVKTFQPPSDPLYMMGTAIDANAANAVLMEETSNGRKYSWSGELKVGNLKFIEDLGQELPSYNRLDTTIAGMEQDTFLVKRVDASQPDNRFEITTAGLYLIELSKRDMKISIGQMSDDVLYIVGDAVVGSDWDPNKAILMKPNPKNIKEFVATITLNADGEGEDSFKILTAQNWEDPAYRPTTANGSITDTSVQLSAGDPDNKWKVLPEQNGTYKVTLNTDPATMSIKFEKQ